MSRKKLKLKNRFLPLILIFLMGCSMTVKTIDKGCKLTGFGSGKGEIKDVCTVEKGLFSWPDLKLQN